MTTEEMIVRILENPDVADVTANAIAAKLRAAEELAALVDHALTLEHLGDGSTKGWAEKVLENYRKAGEMG